MASRFDNTGDDPTIGPGNTVTRPATTPTGSAADTGSFRFTPGTIVAGRYRLVALLGRGGMGEVYRADDLTLDQPVALKFLPANVAADPARLTQFHNELRIARQVSHRNVCRLYDLGEADGRRFLTMEYVDGEDLASLLKRIGRFPPDRAIGIARQLCAGIAAAHERGVIHRDLKPANVMIDGDGNVRITDFGIATAAADAGGELVGTPQYMAPEQLSGRPASIKTDIYALGLILFEVFTGKRAHDATTLQQLKAHHETGVIATPSTIVRELDPAVESVILRCLSKDPERRPSTALAVAAALPGADPLAAALAAGETPSPDLLAAAGEREALPAARGIGAAMWIIAGVLVVAGIAPRLTFARLAPIAKAPPVLADRAEHILDALGYAEARGATASGFLLVGDYVDWIARTDQSAGRWNRLKEDRPPAMMYWYRTSPRVMVPRQLALRVMPTDPAPNDTGMHTIVLDGRGRLLQFNSVPAQFDPTPDAPDRPEPWPLLFDAADLPMSAFKPVPPQWTPRDFGDTRVAWEGALPDRPDVPLRIEAAAYRNLPVSFTIVAPWTRPTRMQPPTRSAVDRIAAAIVALASIFLTIGAAVLARHNFRVGRADAAGATKLAIAAFVIEMCAWIFGFQHVADARAEISSMSAIAGDATLVSMTLWILYAALEPYCRRFWPDMLLGWSRLLSGHFHDPRVGRDLLAGLSAGILWLLIDFARRLIPQALGYPPIMIRAGGELMYTGTVDAIRLWAVLGVRTLLPAFSSVMIFVVLRLAVRRQAVAIAIGMAIIFAWWSSFASAPVLWLEIVFEALIVLLFTYVLSRVGLLAALVALFVSSVGEVVPFTLDVTHWSASGSNETIVLFMTLALLAFVAARAGQPLFGRLDI
ncbi:MAG TPA: serine/threonine-protein kinase [Vicinamibacterales bacterium]